MFCLFPLQVLDKLDLEVLDFCILSDVAILDLYLTWNIKHARIPVHNFLNGNFIIFVVLSLFFRIYAHPVL